MGVTSSAENRSAPRRDVHVWGSIRELGRRGERMLVRNLSSSGLMCQTTAPVERGSFVEVMIPGRCCVNGRVVWADKQKMGIHFLCPI